MIQIKNTQRKISLDLRAIKRDIELILEELKYQNFDLGIWFTNNKTIRAYNNNFRHKDKPTDILSFPYHTDLIAGKRIKVLTEEDKNLGDLIISPEYIELDVQKYQISFETRLRILLVHGICHLLGYDHITDSDYKKMHKLEMAILKKLK